MRERDVRVRAMSMESFSTNDNSQRFRKTADDLGDLAAPRNWGFSGCLSLSLVSQVGIMTQIEELLYISHHMSFAIGCAYTKDQQGV